MVVITLEKSVKGFDNEAGGHRIQRVPYNEKRGRVHTSTVTVSVLHENTTSTHYDDRSPENFTYRWFSGTGKGGQRRNKVMSCLELTHIPSGVSQIANGRSREANAETAMRDILVKLDSMRDDKNGNDQNNIRAKQIGSGMRGDKRRTYRFQDDSIHDHITGKKATCKRFMRGDIDSLWR